MNWVELTLFSFELIGKRYIWCTQRVHLTNEFKSLRSLTDFWTIGKISRLGLILPPKLANDDPNNCFYLIIPWTLILGNCRGKHCGLQTHLLCLNKHQHRYNMHLWANNEGGFGTLCAAGAARDAAWKGFRFGDGGESDGYGTVADRRIASPKSLPLHTF